MYTTVIFRGNNGETLSVYGYPFVANTVYAFSKKSLLPMDPESLKAVDSRVVVGTSRTLPDDAIVDWQPPAKPVATVQPEPTVAVSPKARRG